MEITWMSTNRRTDREGMAHTYNGTVLPGGSVSRVCLQCGRPRLSPWGGNIPGQSIPWTEEHGRLQSMGSGRVRRDWVTNIQYTLEYYSVMGKHEITAICRNTDGPRDYHTKWNSVQFSSVQSLSCVQLCATPWIAARQASLSKDKYHVISLICGI